MQHETILHTRVVTGAGGGPDKTILRSAAYLDSTRYPMAAAYLYPAGDMGIQTLRTSAERFSMPLHPIPERGPIDRRSVRILLDWCRRLRVSVWHSHDYKTDILGRVLRRQHPMKLVSTMHGFTGETWRTRLYARLSINALRGYDRVIAVSPQLMRYAVEHGVHPDRMRYVPNAIDIDEYKRDHTRRSAKTRLKIDPAEHAIVVVARMSVEKGVDRAIRCFAKLQALHPALRLHLVGDGPERSRLESLASELGVNDRICWWGWQQDTRPIVEAMDTLLLPSHTEGLPNVVLEAMAIGLPVAATRVGAVPDVLDKGGCGVLLDNDTSRWPQQLIPLIDLPLVRERLLCAAWLRVRDHYSFDQRMQRIATIYDEVLNRSPQLNATRRQAA